MSDNKVQNDNEDKEINYAISLIKEIVNSERNVRGKIANKFSKSTNNMHNDQLIKVVDYLSNAIEENNEQDNFLEDLLDNVLEKIEGNL